MQQDAFARIRRDIIDHPDNSSFLSKGYAPLYTAGAGARVVVVGQAPGLQAQQSGVPWSDQSGKRLLSWMGIDEDIFYNPQRVSILPMDFYYPGKGKSGDLPPRQGIADLWHPQQLQLMPQASLFLLVGRYAQLHYLGRDARKNLTETVRHYEQYLPRFFPLVHPSPLNFRWFAKNPWFEDKVVPVLKKQVAAALS